MTKKNVMRLAMTLGFFVFILTIGAMSRPGFAQCGKLDDKIISDIYAKIKSDKGLASQLPHFNAVLLSEQSTVKLQGWANNANDWESFQQIAGASNCVKVNVNDFAKTPPDANNPQLNRMSGGSCQDGLKACGSLCIPAGDPCNSEP